MIKNKIVISLAVFMSLGCLGLLFPSVGASLPAMENYFKVGLSSTGAVSSLVQLGYALFCFFGGILSDFFGKKKILIAGAFIYGASGLLLPISDSWLATSILFFTFGTGSGMIFIASNTLVIELFPKKPGSFLNIHHTFFSIGSLVAPMIVRSLLAGGYSWYSIFQYLGIFALILGSIISFSGIKSHVKNEHNADRNIGNSLKTRYTAVLKEKRFLLILAVVFLAIGVQFGLIYLLLSFLVKVRQIEYSTASLVMAAFFALILAGRLTCSYLVSKISSYMVVIALLLMLALTLIVGWLTGGMISLVFFALTGLASSGLMPTIISIAGSTLSPEIRGSALGLLSMAGGLGGMIVTLVVTKSAGFIGFNNSFVLMIILSVLSVFMFIGVYRRSRQSD